MPRMDWKKETGREFEVYPAGTYHVRIINWERLPASTGTEQVRFYGEIIAPEKYRGRSVLDHCALTEAALWRLGKAVSALGVDCISDNLVTDTNGAKFDAILNACKERKVYWLLKEEIFNGKNRNKVEDYQIDKEQDVIRPPELTEEW